MFGKIIHRMIEAAAMAEDPFKILDDIHLENEKMFAAEREMYGEIVDDIRTIMTEYFDYWEDRDLIFLPFKDETGAQRFAEHEFALPLADGIVFKGQIDAIGKTPNKLKWLVENKSFSSLPSDDHRWRNLQSVVYIWAIRELGWVKDVTGVAWNYIKSKPPTIPSQNQDGSLSKKEIVTLPSVVRKALKQYKLSEVTHAAVIARAEKSREEYFQRIFTPVNETIFEKIFDGFLDSAREMSEHHGRKKDMNIGRHCEWCDYEPICRAELTGGDVDFVKEREFEHEAPGSHHRSHRKEAGGKPGDEGASSEKARGTRSPQLRVLRPKRNG